MSRNIVDIADIAAFEQEADGFDDTAQTGPDNRPADGLGLETPEADAVEQRVELVEEEDEPTTEVASDQEEEADPADAADQRRVVAIHEDDYR